MTQQNIQAALFEFTTVDEVVAKHHAKELLPACTYSTPAIPMFGEPCPNPLVKKTHTISHPAVYLAEVDNYKMIGGCAFPIVDDKCVKPQFFDINTWETSEQARKKCMIKDNMIAYSGFKQNSIHNLQVINLIGNGSFNYAHWMSEFLPTIVLLKNSNIDLKKYHILIAEKSFQSMVDALLLLGIDHEKIIKIPDFSFNQFKSCLWVSPLANIVFQRPNARNGDIDTLASPDQATFHPEALKATAKFYLEKLNTLYIDQISPELIYITRKTDRSLDQRMIFNEDYIRTGLEKLGFQTIDTSDLSFIEQVKFFSNAKCIISASGAALLNMLWAPKGAEIIILMNDSKVANYWYFSNLATSLGHQSSYVLGEILPVGKWVDVNHADYSVDFSEIVRAISKSSKLINIEVKDKHLHRLTKLKERKIAFLVHEPLLLSHYREVWKLLDKHRFCVIFSKNFSQNQDKKDVDDIVNYLKKENCLYDTFDFAINNGIVFDYVITNHIISKHLGKPISLSIGRKHIRFMYGADVGDGWSLQPWNEIYDYFLCHGENDKKAIESRFKGKTFVMGYPRYDSYFDTKLDTNCVIDEFNLDRTRKTILWMPTLGGDYSSIPRFAEKLKYLIGSYNFIIRPHPISFVQEPEFIELLEKCGYIIDRKATRDLNPLYKIADIVLADNGGSPFSAIFMGKNVIFLEVPEDLGSNKNSHHIVNTSVYELKKELPVIKQNNPEELKKLLSSKNFYQENSLIVEMLFQKYFNCPRGGGAKRVVDILNSLDYLA